MLKLITDKHALDMLGRVSMENCKLVSTLMAIKQPPFKNGDRPYHNPSHYRGLVSALQYFTLVRFNLSLAVNMDYEYMHASTVYHFQLAKQILQYIHGTLDLGFRIKSWSSLHLFAFTNTDWARCKATQQSTSGLCMFLGPNCIW